MLRTQPERSHGLPQSAPQRSPTCTAAPDAAMERRCCARFRRLFAERRQCPLDRKVSVKAIVSDALPTSTPTCRARRRNPYVAGLEGRNLPSSPLFGNSSYRVIAAAPSKTGDGSCLVGPVSAHSGIGASGL